MIISSAEIAREYLANAIRSNDEMDQWCDMVRDSVKDAQAYDATGENIRAWQWLARDFAVALRQRDPRDVRATAMDALSDRLSAEIRYATRQKSRQGLL